jgi:hypothetical protein
MKNVLWGPKTYGSAVSEVKGGAVDEKMAGGN